MDHPITITGNPVAFADASDLTDETHDTILTILELEMANTFGPDFLKTGIRALAKVGELAIASGWDWQAALALEKVAGQIYADIFRDATRDLNARRRISR
jgi:hypothetical protein